jgi:hypothetical protein
MTNKIKSALMFSFPAMLLSTTAYAANEMDQVKNRVIAAIQQVSGPLGFIFVFGGVVLIALRLMVQHNNPNRRSETIAGLPWLAAGAIILGSAMLIANIIFSLGQG